ncbi:hypothetical protein [Allokutzneria oryzae]|uniref:DUF4282 domain-containing protein n=1 Tax=Allokutzneria oryzae TaxID=1378989 RepID=A0ABV6A7V1_9PSEU
MFDWLVSWWDSVEFWVAGLWFPFQFVLVMAVLLPACWGVALGIDRGVDRVSAALSTARKNAARKREQAS